MPSRSRAENIHQHLRTQFPRALDYSTSITRVASAILLKVTSLEIYKSLHRAQGIAARANQAHMQPNVNLDI